MEAIIFLVIALGTLEYHKFVMRNYGGGLKFFIAWLIVVFLIISLLAG